MGLKSYKKSQRPRCPYCKHAPFRTAKGYNWHLRHIHPDEEYVSVSDVREGVLGDNSLSDSSLEKQGKRRFKEIFGPLYEAQKRAEKRKKGKRG